jgi:hypothetical protein
MFFETLIPSLPDYSVSYPRGLQYALVIVFHSSFRSFPSVVHSLLCLVLFVFPQTALTGWTL